MSAYKVVDMRGFCLFSISSIIRNYW